MRMHPAKKLLPSTLEVPFVDAPRQEIASIHTGGAICGCTPPRSCFHPHWRCCLWMHPAKKLLPSTLEVLFVDVPRQEITSIHTGGAICGCTPPRNCFHPHWGCLVWMHAAKGLLRVGRSVIYITTSEITG